MTKHTYHPNTFGLLYGRTTKTACSKRVPTGQLTRPAYTTCPECISGLHEAAIIDGMIRTAALDIAREAGYDSIESYVRNHK